MNINAQKRAKLCVIWVEKRKKLAYGDGLWHLPNGKMRFYGN